MRRHRPWTVLDSRDLLDASPFLKLRVETVELPDGRRIDDYYQIEAPSFACVLAETEDGRIITYRQYRHGPRARRPTPLGPCQCRVNTPQKGAGEISPV